VVVLKKAHRARCGNIRTPCGSRLCNLLSRFVNKYCPVMCLQFIMYPHSQVKLAVSSGLFVEVIDQGVIF
jgi:hypothetical protein